MKDPVYSTKLERMESGTLMPHLAPKARAFVRSVAAEHRLTFQELRAVAEAARDLEMWREEPLEAWWRRAEAETQGNGRPRKKALMRRLREHLDSLSAGEKAYPDAALQGAERRPIRLVERETERQIFGLCAAYSEKTVCCGLHTIDAVMGCPFGCSYCTIQTFYGETAELQTDLASKLDAIELDPDRFYHIGTGQSSDSLVWGNRGGNLDALSEFAARHPNVLLELKTKSANVRHLLEREVPANVVCSWSLNSETVIANEEHGTAPLERRLAAARAVADRGVRLAFHFHPMVYHRGWREGYASVVRSLRERFSPAEVAFVSMGSVTLIRPVARQIRRRGGETKILQMEMATDPHGKLTYPEPVKVELFRHLYGAFEPWHEEVFFYLCMETAPVWEAVLGRSYPTNDDFERDFGRRCPPIPGRRGGTGDGASGELV